MMLGQVQRAQLTAAAQLELFLDQLKQLADAIYEEEDPEDIEDIASGLRRAEPAVTQLIKKALGNSPVEVQMGQELKREPIDTLISRTLLGGRFRHIHFRQYNPVVVATLERAIGALASGVTVEEPLPAPRIKDTEPRARCSDLLKANGSYDRAIVEATRILEDRMRRKPGHDLLARLIPNAADQTGEKLVNGLFSPDRPVLSISSDKAKRIALHRMLLAIVSYMRNDYHHRLKEDTQLSCAWGAVILIDRLLEDIESCTLPTPSASES